MISVVAYMKVIPPGNKKPQKPLIIKNFIDGVNACGDKGIISNSWTVIPADVSVLQGFVHQQPQKHRHLMLRRLYSKHNKKETNAQ